MTMPKMMELHWPMRGVVRRESLRAQSASRGPYPAPWSLNVRLEDSLTNRLRGGSWAGIASTAIPADRSFTLLDSSGDTIQDGAGNDFVVDTQESIASSGGRIWVAPGASAPGEGDADVIYRGRLIRLASNEILASRQGNYEDFEYGGHVDDTGRAFVIQLSESGEVGGNVVALIPHKDRFLLGFTSTSMWAIQGDPTADGVMRNVSREVGMVTARSWCKDHLDRLYFLSSHGLYAANADGSGLEPISEDFVPDELTGVTDVNTVLHYNHADRGVYIEIPTAAVSWFYDTERKQFWPYSTGSSNSHVAIGPLRLGRPNHFGRMINMHGMISTGSGTVNWRIVTGDTAEDAAANAKTAIETFEAAGDYSSYVKASGAWTAGRANMSYPRVRAVWCCLWLQAAAAWAYEGCAIETMESGRWRGA
jgi:hypothetical protein